jgi:hypothetical protein
MEAETVSKTLDYNAIFTWLIAQEHFIAQAYIITLSIYP